MRSRSSFLLVLLLYGCDADGPTRDEVIADVAGRSGFTLPRETVIGRITLPPGASMDDGLTEDEAVSIALWNNAAFRETLVNLDVASGELLQAGLLPNPIGSFGFASDNKPFKYAFELPLEALWLRPLRIKAAKAEAERVAHQLSQSGLNLIRDARRAYSDMLQAQAQLKLLERSLSLRRHIAALAQKRLDAGDISLQEGNVAALDAMAAEQAASRGRSDIQASEERLRFMMGVGGYVGAFRLDPLPAPECRELDVDSLVEEGLRNRPDALSAQQASIAAEERSHLSLLGWLGIGGIGDATSGRKTGHELTPAVRATVPVLNANSGNIDRADAEAERAARGEQTVAHQIRLDVYQAYVQYRQACSELGILRVEIMTGVEADTSRVAKAYESGDVPYLMVLQSNRAVIDARLREAQLVGDVARASSDLERSVGSRIPREPASGTTPADDQPSIINARSVQ